MLKDHHQLTHPVAALLQDCWQAGARAALSYTCVAAGTNAVRATLTCTQSCGIALATPLHQLDLQRMLKFEDCRTERCQALISKDPVAVHLPSAGTVKV